MLFMCLSRLHVRGYCLPDLGVLLTAGPDRDVTRPSSVQIEGLQSPSALNYLAMRVILQPSADHWKAVDHRRLRWIDHSPRGGSVCSAARLGRARSHMLVAVDLASSEPSHSLALRAGSNRR